MPPHRRVHVQHSTTVRGLGGTGIGCIVATLLLFAASRAHARTCDVVADCGAPTDNTTIATPHLLACFAKCGPFPEVVVPSGLALQVLPINLTGLATNGRLVFGTGAALYATCDPTGWPLVPMLPLQGPTDLQFAPIIGGAGVWVVAPVRLLFKLLSLRCTCSFTCTCPCPFPFPCGGTGWQVCPTLPWRAPPAL
jgi:hypothetical protein